MNLRITMSLAFVSPALGQSYSVQTADLGPDVVAAWATDVTEDGRVVGTASVEGGRRTFGYVWRDGVVEQLVVPQAGNMSVFPRSFDIHHHVGVLAMSDGGFYAGAGGNVNLGFTQQPYFAWLPYPDPYPPQHVAGLSLINMIVHDIADTTPYITAVGAGMDGNNRRKGFISLLSKTDDVGNPARITFLSGFGGALGDNACAFAVNNSGDVVGFATNSTGFHRPFLRPSASGVMTDLGTLGGPSGEAFDISNSGYIVGQADVGAGRPHAFLRAPGGGPLLDLGTLGGATSAARAVNDAGLAVGESWTAGGLVHAFLAQGTQMLDLNSRLPAGSGWVLTHASGISNKGWIVGWGRFEGTTRGFLLVPESCYADCNADGQLTIADFGCFQTKFVNADPYADCNGSATLTIADFGCFQGAFAAGCP